VGDKIQKNEMGGACNKYGGGERRVKGFGGYRNYLEYPCIDGRMDLQEVGCGSMDCFGLTLNRDRWWALVNAVTNL
jgi:hypothetical protein